MKHAAGQPVVLTDFIPASGGATTEVLITGDNFSSDTSALKVTINGKPCKIVGANTKQIMVIVPKRCGSGNLVVSIGKDSVVSSAPFNYIFTRTVTTLAGNGTAGYADGKGADAMFNFNGQSWFRMMGIATDDKGNVFVTDPGNNCIRKIDAAGNATVLAGSPGHGGGDEGQGSTARFSIPYGVATDAAGNVYVADPGVWHIRKITPDGTTSSLGDAAQEPWNIAVDKKSGRIFYSNPGNGVIMELKSDGSSETFLSGINNPGGMSFDKDGNLYVSSYGDQTILKFKAGTWERSVIAGTTGAAGFVNGIGAAARFANPWGLAVGDNGMIYVAGNGSYGANVDESIRAVYPNTWEVITYAGGGTPGFSDGIGGLAAFNAPMGVTVDKNDVVYVLDKNNNRVRKIVSE
ncbi:IPT/TIG domain-containing protein [Chitinophaga sp.]|uniref:IPT/TIG domain-containing protein n=1 Tax=Chitinophaga sp. TaxID=1869181 RepID=UPI0025BF34C1|nr:IPT/TIG domain-containing protein [Chitinophaga sp.]